MQSNYEIMSTAKRKCMSKTNMVVTWTGREERWKGNGNGTGHINVR